MKNLKTLAAGLLITFSLSSFAAEPLADKRSISKTLNTYVDAVVHGKTNGIEAILDKDFKYTVTRGEKIVNHKRSEVLELMKQNKGIEQNCSTYFRVLESTATQSLVKVTMKYDGFSSIAYVNLAFAKDGWKITNISSSVI